MIVKARDDGMAYVTFVDSGDDDEKVFQIPRYIHQKTLVLLSSISGVQAAMHCAEGRWHRC
jgi:hypothetical protein